jgi:SP family sugar:H+ symporter-like MFS transporter
LTPYANKGIGYAFGFVFFGCNFAAAAIVYFFVFETKALSLEHCSEMYTDMSIKAPQSKKWVPAGYINRGEKDEAYWRRRRSVDTKIDDKDAQSTPRTTSVHNEALGDERRV